MSQSERPSDEVLRNLDERASALEQRRARPMGAAKGQAVDQAYRLIAELIGGVLVGLAVGFGVDRITGVTAPWGLIGGVLLGFAVSIWMAKKTADRLTAQAATEALKSGPPAAVAFDEDD